MRPWYAAAASGPKDIVIVVDGSGGKNAAGVALAKAATAAVLDTLTASDYGCRCCV